jgi:saccharopine dehydrogenase (NAD+, L-lysine-forming)
LLASSFESSSELMKNLAGPVVVVGADGLVGGVVSAKLASVLPKRVVVGGRNLWRINALADSLGSGVVALHLEPDVDIVARGSNCAVVVMCAEMPDAAVARGCVAAGIHYVDGTASCAPVMVSIARLQPIARASGASAMVSVGLAPSLTNVLAAAAVRAAPSVTRQTRR